MAWLEFTIPGRLPGMNEIIELARRHWLKYADAKKTWTGACMMACPGFYRGKQLARMGRVDIHIKWYEPNEKRDPDNIMAGQKFILDAIVKRKILDDDSSKEIASLTHEFFVDARNPRIVVSLKDVE